ncbi:MAG: 4Fe-4S dicluster domain-containing protein [Myxococcota bacterium]
MADGSLDKSLVTLEFPDGSEKLTVSRREFLRVATVAAAGTAVTNAGCQVAVEEVVPYAKRPDGVYHTGPVSYTSVCRACPSQCGLLMQVREGRPVKLEGNPNHPVGQGGLCSRGQGAILDLYSPDRILEPRDQAGKEITWEALDADIKTALAGVRTGGLRVLTGAKTGPSELAFMDTLAQIYKGARHVMWEPLMPTAARWANNAAYGVRAQPSYRFDRAKAIVSLGGAFLDNGQANYTRQYAATRNPDKEMSKLTVFEGRLTLTGIAADERHRVRPSDLVYVGLALAHELILKGAVKGWSSDPAIQATLKPFTIEQVSKDLGLEAAALSAAAQTLKEAGSRGLVVAMHHGNHAGGETLEAVAALINEALGAVGTTVDWERASFQGGNAMAEGGYDALAQLVEEMNAGKVKVLVIDDINPVFNAPPELKFAEALGKVGKVVYVGQMYNETAAKSSWVGAKRHYLESWSDSNPMTGVYSIQQPGLLPLGRATSREEMMRVVGNTRTLEDCFITWTQMAGMDKGTAFEKAIKANTAYTDPQEMNRPAPGPWFFFMKSHWETAMYTQAQRPLSFERFWEDLLREGVWVNNAPAPERTRYNAAKALAKAPKARTAPAGMEVELFASTTLYDGRQIANGVLQECPDPVTQTAWGAYAALAPKRFVEMGLEPGSVVEVKTDKGGLVTLPALPLPGLHHDVVAVPLGYGRTHAGAVGTGLSPTGNGYGLATLTADGVSYTGISAQVKATGGFEQLGMPLGKGHVIDLHERDLVPLTTKEEYDKNKEAGIHRHPQDTLWPGHTYDFKWGMAIDLSLCTGCSACVVACQVENNIPVVGKQGIIQGRQMSWLRIDRYYKLPAGNDYTQEMLTQHPQVAAAKYLENPTVLLEPMLCQHCDNAPCETVCPVLATVHSDDGLNVQVYNRCVGTRYCANNCPYKVRRFNWFNYASDRSEEFFADVFSELKDHAVLNVAWPLPLKFNPEVTVRIRGVMEKCSFCLQRIKKYGRVSQKLGIVPEEPLQTACQQTCSANAITFGNTADPTSEVSKKIAMERNFQVLSHLGTKPAVRYLTRVRNTKPEPGAGHGAHGGAGDHGGGAGADHGGADHGAKDKDKGAPPPAH